VTQALGVFLGFKSLFFLSEAVLLLAICPSSFYSSFSSFSYFIFLGEAFLTCFLLLACAVWAMASGESQTTANCREY
jgi:hypothetical protein